MRIILILALLVTSGLAGCLSGDDQDNGWSPAGVLSPATIHVPAGATLEPMTDGFRLVWADQNLPFVETIEVPAGATMVRFVADPGENGTVSVSMSHGETDRRRCNQQSVVNLGQALTGPRSCSSITALDPPGTPWRVSAGGASTVANVSVEFLDRPLDGIAALLDLSQLSQREFEIAGTAVHKVPSFDGIELHVEVTLPEGPGPWPTVIASSPYNQPVGPDRPFPAMWGYFVHDWASRGYAVIVADVRGYGESHGCVEVWGKNEQRDQAFLVDWVAAQDWSDGNVGFYGQSYVGTTPVAAAVQNPSALKAIIAVAPVISAYDDWHYGGVPNGENALSPVAYQTLTGVPFDTGSMSPMQFALAASGGVCYPHMTAEANDPRAIFNTFYYDRNFKLGAPHVEAAVLFTQGFEDANVKSAMIPGWFNELPGPKLGVFGHWLHQHPARMDQEVLFLAWMDHYVKGRDLGFDRVPNVVVNVDESRHRTAADWPPTAPVVTALYPSFSDAGLAGEPANGGATVTLEPVGVDQAAPAIVLRGPAPGETSLAGEVQLHVRGSFTGLANAYVGATLIEERADGSERLLTWGQFNLAHRFGHDRYAPLVPGEAVSFAIPLRPTEHVIAADSILRLEIRGVGAASAIPFTGLPGQLTLQGGVDGTWLEIPGVPLSEYGEVPITARP